ncbi:MAG: DUF523 and DUF1722 domain-containing protein [Nitrospira sp.]|nr:DUF523 and DUF1722 domain-containing protein [Nitrospira sp.]
MNMPIRLGISRCLLGEPVRFDGGHKRDAFLVDMLGRHVEWVPVCPEVEIGLGTPRESLRLEGSLPFPRLITINTGHDHTQHMEAFSKRRLQELNSVGLCGFVFKKNSPSCGLERVRVYNRHGMPNRNGTGLFAQAFRQSFPLLPVEEEGRLLDLSLRENFIARVFGYQRWREHMLTEPDASAMIQFHTRHKYLLLSHSRKHYERLGRLVASAARYTPTGLVVRYGLDFVEALTVKATVRKHTDVLQHIVGHLKEILTASERTELAVVIEDYRNRLVPLVAPLVLLKHFIESYHVTYLKDQVYFDPYPKEFMLRSHVPS